MDATSNEVKKPVREDVDRRDDSSRYWSGGQGKGITDQDHSFSAAGPVAILRRVSITLKGSQEFLPLDR
jgi:hypothetical protein